MESVGGYDLFARSLSDGTTIEQREGCQLVAKENDRLTESGLWKVKNLSWKHGDTATCIDCLSPPMR